MQRTAEFVSPSHPDKLCDRISDSILDEYLKQDPLSRVAVETTGGHGKVFITGEITSNGHVTDDAIRDIVYSISKVEDVTIHLVQQSPEIAQGVDTGGAGDQGIMIGYACNENNELVPQEYYLARKLNKLVYSHYPFDGKTQVTITSSDTLRVVCSFQNAPADKLKVLCEEFFDELGYTIETLHCNPAGDWNQGGFDADAGVTGRKLAVDNYGPRVPLGGGAFSGKDSTKVDRSAAYMARAIAVNLLKEANAKEVLVRLAYAIGYEYPLEATAIVDGEEVGIVSDKLTPKNIINNLDLTKPIFSKTAEWGHMGQNFNWK